MRTRRTASSRSRAATLTASGQGGAAPPFDRTQARLLPLADLVMIAMLSRPPAGSLRHTWVTAVTVVLSLAVVVAALALAILVLLRTVRGGSPVVLLAEVPLVTAAVGAADLALFGIRQRLLSR